MHKIQLTALCGTIEILQPLSCFQMIPSKCINIIYCMYFLSNA